MASVMDRDRHSWEGSAYVMPCDSEEARRLTRQHDSITHSLKGSLLIFPSSVITQLSRPSTRILDAGTGNGVWLNAFYSSISPLPSMTGIDISNKMFPTDYPSSMTFETGSVLDLPSHWSDRFDLVHQRFLFAALTVAQWPVACGEQFRVTRPGGWLHLVELNLRNTAVGPDSTKLMLATRKLFELNGIDFQQADKVVDVVREAGWSDVQVYDQDWCIDGSGQKETLARENVVQAHKAMGGLFIKSELFESEKEFNEIMRSAEREWETMRGEPLVIKVITARKPEG